MVDVTSCDKKISQMQDIFAFGKNDDKSQLDQFYIPDFLMIEL